MLRRKAKYKGLIISFEPNPDAAAALRVKAAKNPAWIIEEIALADHDGEQTFHIMSDSLFSSLKTPRHDVVDLFRDMNKISESVTVKTETLTSAFKRLKNKYNFQRPFLKLDTQGLDVMVVKSGESVIHEFVGLQSELSVKRIYEDSVDYKDALRYYEGSGFSLSAFVPNNVGVFPQLVETDCIMVRTNLE